MIRLPESLWLQNACTRVSLRLATCQYIDIVNIESVRRLHTGHVCPHILLCMTEHVYNAALRTPDLA